MNAVASIATPATPDYLNTKEDISFRLGAALRDGAVSAFVAGCYGPEFDALVQVAPALAGTCLGEHSVYTLTEALYNRTAALDAAAERTGSKRFTKLADKAQAAQVAWTEAFQAWQRAKRA
jgi:hypothetical protein